MPQGKLTSVIGTAVLVGLTGCASFGSQPEPQQWVTGTYEFQTVLHGERISGLIEVGEQGPTAVTTSLSACMPRASETWRPWSRARTFDCAGDHAVVVSAGTEVGPPIGGVMRNTTLVTRDQVVSRTCVQYEELETGTRVCREWHETTEKVTRPVVESARILIVASSPPVPTP